MLLAKVLGKPKEPVRIDLITNGCKTSRQAEAPLRHLALLAVTSLILSSLSPSWLRAASGCRGLFQDQVQASTGLREDSPLVSRLVSKELPEIEKLFRQILRRYPMNEYEFVLVGRSPALLQAYLHVQSDVFRDLTSWTLPVSLKSHSEVSRQELQVRFEELFYKFRGSREPSGKKLVFIDFVSEGRTFLALQRLLVELGIEGQLLGFAHNSARVAEVLKGQSQLIPIELFEISLALELSIAGHKPVAPYRSHRIEEADYILGDSDPRVTLPTYREALRSVRRELEYE